MKKKNKSLKIILGILIALVVTAIIIIALIIKCIIPNPFWDTKDLVCSLENKYTGFSEEHIFIAQFNKDATIKNYKTIYKITYENIEDLRSYADYLKSVDIKYKYNETEKNIIIEIFIEVNKKDSYYKKTKNEINNIFLNELYYSRCDNYEE